MSPFDRVHTTSCSTLVEPVCLSCTISEIKLFVKSRRFYLSYVHLVPPLRGDPVQISDDLWHQETVESLPGLSCGIVCVIPCLTLSCYTHKMAIVLCDPMFNPFDTVPACNGQTDGWMHSHSIYSIIRSSVVKMVPMKWPSFSWNTLKMKRLQAMLPK